MAKQLNVSLAFTADTEKARAQLQDLQKSLEKLISTTNTNTSNLGLTKELAAATTEASKLKIMLESATSASGGLDLGKFNQELKKSGMELKDYAEILSSLGPEGSKTFAKLAQSITTANVPLKQTNKLLNEFAITMKNTVRWQLSSSMLHGFMGAVSGALGYAKDLNKSLNDIRIVTGYNTDQMAKFAEEANRAAKALSSTTTDYTNASLIYYQQGLPEDEIAKRTEVTLKMANAAGVSAQTVSDQMTAVWNNFDDGSKSLEYYADVMTALGAATASSTDEISAGLNKFAAVAETVGLSYEYATAALATVTATTRESADVVGTAFKTLFARIQGLKLGETLDDGTTLNKYSEALAKVGISIFETNGEMKSMNNILDEMGTKWGTMSKDQQTALAQTVAGVRQYTQLMALMNNWDYFKENVEVAKESTGTLQKQAEIYAESWEASSKRVKAAAEGIYDKLLDEQFFIGVNKILEGTLSQVGNLVDGLGGLPGVLSVISSLMLKAFGKDIVNSMERMAYNIKLSSKVGREEILQLRKDANKQMASMNDDGSISGSTSVDVYKQESKLQEEILQKTFELEARNKSLTEEEQKQVGLLVDKNHELGQQIIHLAQAREQQEATTKSLQSQLLQKTQYTDKTEIVSLNEKLAKIKEQQIVYSTFQPLFEKLRESAEKIVVGGKSNNLTQYRTEVKTLEKSLKEMGLTIDDITSGKADIISPETVQRIKDFFNIVKTGSKEEIQKALQDIQDDLAAVGADAELNFQKLKNSLNELDGVDKSGINKLLSEIQSSFMETGRLSEEQIQKFKNLGVQIDESGRIIQGFNGKVYTTADSMMALAHVITGLSSALNMIKGLGNIWSDEDTSYGEKVIATLSSVAMILPTLINAYKTWNNVKLTGVKNDLLALATQKLKNNIDQKGLVIKFSENALQKIKNKELSAEIVLKTILNALDLKKIAIYTALAIIIGTVVAAGKLLYDAYHQDAKAAKEANEQAKIMTERYQEAEAAAKSLKETISNWDDAVKALEELDHNTQEYADALDEANKKAKELIETYGLWSDYHLEEGVIKFNDGVLERIQNEANAEANKAEQEHYQAEIYNNEAQIRKQSTDQLREVGSFGTGTYHTVYAEDGSYQVENYRQLSNDETEYIADVANNLQQSLGGVAPTTEQLRAELQKLSEGGQLGADALSNLSSIITDSTMGGFLSLGDSMAEAAEASKYYAEQILKIGIEENYGDKIRELATDKEGNVNQALAEQITQAFTNRAAKQSEEEDRRIDEEYAAVEDDVKDIVNTDDLNDFLDNYTDEEIKAVLGDNYDGDIEDDEELGLMYASMLTGDAKNTLTYKGGIGVGTVTDAEGDKVFSEISDEVMRREIAKKVAMSSITAQYIQGTSGETKTAEELAKLETALGNIISGGSKTAEKYGADFSTAILNSIANEDFESLDFSSLFTELTPQEIEELSGLDKDGILSMLGISKQDLIDAGYNVDTFISAFGTALDEWTYQLDTSGLEQKASFLNEIIDGLKTGAVVEKETVLKLQELGINIDDYFTKMADGSYKLVGIAEDLVNILKDEIQQDYINKILEAESAQAVATNTINEQYADTYAGSHWMDTSVTALDGMGSNTQQMYQARRNYINEAGGASVFGFTEEQAALLEKSSWTWEEMQELNAMFETATQSASILQEQLFSTASYLSELDNLKGQLNSAGLEEINYNAYAEALIGLASAYENCTEEIENYNLALASGNVEEVAKAEAVLRSSIAIGEAAEKYNLNAEEVKTQAALMADEFNLSAEAAAELAIQNQRMNDGVAALSENWEDWKKILTTVNKDLGKVDKTSKDYAKALTEVNKVVKQLTGVHDDFEIPKDFYEMPGIIEDIDKAAEGDIDAINRLGLSLAKVSIEGMEFNSSFVNSVKNAATEMGKVDPFAAFETNKQKVIAGIQDLQAVVANGAINVGDSVDSMGADWAASLNQMAMQTGMSVEQMNSLLSSMGVDAEVITEYVPQTVKVPIYRTEQTNQEYDKDGNLIAYDSKTWQTGVQEMEGVVPVAQINMGEGGDSPDIKYIGNGSIAPSSTGGGSGGGGGSKPKKADKVKKSNVVDRYKETDDKLDDIRDKMDDASKAADRLWGPARLKQMKKVNEALEDEINALKEKRKEAENYLKQDKKDLINTGKENGVSFTFDANGNISNYDVEMTKLYNELDAAINAANADGNADENEQEKIDKIQERIDKVKEAINQYDETRELIEDLNNDIQDKIYEWQDNNYEQLNYKLELEIEINDSELELLEYYLGKIEDDIYATAEAFGYMNQQVDVYTNKLEAQEEYVKKLEEDYLAGRISLDAYKEGLRESQSAMIENLEALQESKEAIQDYYGEVMNMAIEEISLYTDEMEELNSVLDHYSNILELVGKQEDYATKGKVLQSKATNLRNEMQVQQELYERSNAEAEKWAAKMATAIEGSNEYETYKKNWIAAQEAANEAQDNMLSKTEEWAEAMKAIIENELAGLAKTMEKSLTGGTSFDELLTSMERRSSLQEEYLTTTNQIYETNKLMRQAQQEIDKTTNSVAKRKLANFINETEQMQNQTELSQYELDIQQAKYDLLLAEIALEEAQSAKSTVRLQRDSEGNFGYIYTADQAAVADAEQELADKQNALYNLGLEGANDYSQKYAETMQEAQDAITELTEMWMNGEIESEEEYQRRRAEIQDYYYEKLKQYSSLYQIALTTDSNVIKDAWSTDFSDMIYKTEDWKVATDDYFAGAAESMKIWAEVCGTVLKESGLDDVSKKIGEINTKSENLKKTLIGEDGESGVVGAMMSEVEAAGKLSEAYIGIQNQIDEVIKKYEEMMGVINEDYTNENTLEVETEPEPEVPAPEPESPEIQPEESATPELNVGSTVTVKKSASRWVSGESIWNPVKGNNFKVKQINGEKVLIGDPSGPNYSASGITGWIKKTDLEGFATGGYTGDWEGPYGKLAMLHQKELVLNAGDTENFLASMELLDKIVSAIDLYSMNSQLGGALSSPSLGNMGSGDVLEQQVHIEASFPGVQDRNEIEEAFNTLINRASQYANRK